MILWRYAEETSAGAVIPFHCKHDMTFASLSKTKLHWRVFVCDINNVEMKTVKPWRRNLSNTQIKNINR